MVTFAHAVSFPVRHEIHQAGQGAILVPAETTEQAAERARVAIEARAKREAVRAAAQPRLHAAKAQLDSLGGLARVVLDLHASDGREYPECTGCEYRGWEADPIDWPCATFDLVARFHGVDAADLRLYDPGWGG